MRPGMLTARWPRVLPLHSSCAPSLGTASILALLLSPTAECRAPSVHRCKPIVFAFRWPNGSGMRRALPMRIERRHSGQVLVILVCGVTAQQGHRKALVMVRPAHNLPGYIAANYPPPLVHPLLRSANHPSLNHSIIRTPPYNGELAYRCSAAPDVTYDLQTLANKSQLRLLKKAVQSTAKTNGSKVSRHRSSQDTWGPMRNLSARRARRTRQIRSSHRPLLNQSAAL